MIKIKNILAITFFLIPNLLSAQEFSEIEIVRQRLDIFNRVWNTVY